MGDGLTNLIGQDSITDATTVIYTLQSGTEKKTFDFMRIGDGR